MAEVITNWTPEDLKASLDSGNKVFLKLWKEGCGACKLSEPAIERIMAADQSGIQFGQISINEYPEMMELADSEVLPLFFVFRDKQLKGKVIGFKGIAKLQELIKEHLS